MAQTYTTGLIITGDASGGIRAIKATEDELGKLNQRFDRGARQSKQFGADASRAGQQLRDIDTGANEASQGLEVLRSNVVGVAAAMATAFGANSIIQQSRIIADTDALAQSIGIATSELQAWDYAAQQAGFAGGQMGDILKDITEKIGEFTAEGTGEAAALFENLNLNIEEMKRLSPDQQLLRISEAISTLETRGEKISYLERLGNDATRLLPLLDNNAALLREYTNEAQALGVAMSQVDIENAVQANRAMAQLSGTMDGFKNQIAADLGPGLAEAVGGLTAFIQEAGGASSILNEVKDVAAITAAVLAGRYAAAMVTATQATLQKLAADRAAAAQSALSMEVEAGRAAMQARTTAAEMNTAAVRATIAAQEAAQERAAAAQDVQRLQRLQAQLAAEKTLAAQRLAEQSNAAGRMQVQARINQLHTAELSATNQLTAATTRLNQAEAATVSTKRLATAASIEKTRADTAATAAVGRYTAATHAATSANTLLAASGRAASRALALVGGPLGLLVGAGGLLYAFRDELGLTLPQIDANTTAVHKLTAGLDDMSQAAAQLTLTSLVGQLAEVRAQAEVTNETIRAVQNDDVTPTTGGFLGYSGEELLRQNEVFTEIGEASREAEQKAANLEAAIALVEGRLGELGRQSQEVTPTITEVGDATETAAAKAKAHADAADAQAAALEDLRNSLISGRRETVQLAQDTNTLALAMAMGRGNTVQLIQMMGQLQQKYIEGQRETDNLATASEDASQRIARSFLSWETVADNTLRRIDDSGQGLWLGLIDGSESALDTVKRGFQQTLAEIAHMLTTQKLTFEVAGMMGLDTTGMPGGGGFNLNALGSLGRSASSLLGFGGSAAAPSLAMQGGLSSAALASASQVAGGATYGGWAGSAASGAALGKAASGGVMSAISSGVATAMPWIAGGLAIDSLLGGGITKAISGLFGGRKTNPHLNIDTRATDNYGHGSVRTGAFGAVGFGQGTRRSNDLFGGIDKEREFLAAVAASDDLLASLARSPAELERMADAVQGVRLSASGVDGIMAQLSNRTVAAVSAIDGEFGEFVGGLGTDVDTLIARSQSAMGALNLLGAASENLNLQFDVSASGALRAADSIAQLAGGVDQLAGLQESYYQAYFSDAERAADLQRELTKTLAQMGMTLPSTHDGFRQLVEQQNRLTESGQRNYVQLLQLAGPFDQLQQMLQQTGTGVDTFADRLSELNSQMGALENDVRRAYQAFESQAFDQQITLLKALGDEQAVLNLQRERELQSIDPLLHETQRFIWAMEDEAQAKNAATQAAQRYISELSSVRDQLASSLGSISQWVDQQRATGSAPGSNLGEAQAQFARQLVLAESGDRNALQSITQYADQVLQANDSYNASSAAGQRIRDDVLAALDGLPEAISDAEFIVNGFRDVVSSEMAREIERAIFSSRYKIDTLIEFAANATDLPADLRTILGEQVHRLDSTLNYLLGENQLDAELRQLALLATNNLVATVDYITGSTLSTSDKMLALSSSNTMTAVIDYVLGTDIDRDSRVLALEESNRYSAFINMILGRDISAADRRLALESVNGFTSIVDYVIRSPLTGGDRRLALSAGQHYEALIGYYVDADISRQDRQLALNSGNQYLSMIDLVLGKNLSADNRRLALSSNNRFVSIIDTVIGKQITGGDRRLALGSTNLYTSIVDAVFASGINADVRTLALSYTNAIMATIDGVLAPNMSGDVKTLALKKSNTFLTTLHTALADGRLSADERRVLDAKSESIVKTLRTGGNLSLSADEWAVINAASGSRRLELLADVAFGRTDLDHLADIDDNTKPLAEQARDQLKELTGLVGEMSRTTDQFVGLNSNIVSLRDSINALGVAQAEVARIEKERAAAEKAERERIARERLEAQRGSLTSEIERLQKEQKNLASSGVSAPSRSVIQSDYRHVPDAINVINGFAELFIERQGVSQNAADRLRAYFTKGPGFKADQGYGDAPGAGGAYSPGGLYWPYVQAYIEQIEREAKERQTSSKHLASQIADLQAQLKGLGAVDGSHATGLWNVPFDNYIAELHRDEMVVPAETASRLRELPSRELPMPALPNFPLLNRNDQHDVVRDLLNENKQLRKELTALLKRIEQHGAAGVAVQQEAAKQQISELKKSNLALDDMSAAARLEASR